MSKVRKVLLFVVLPLMLLWVPLTVWAFTTAAPAAPSQPRQVAQFNDGYATGMQDACEQGSAYACHWLAMTP